MLETGSPAPSLPQLPFRFGRVKKPRYGTPGEKERQGRPRVLGKLCGDNGEKEGPGFEVGDVGISKAWDTMPSSEELLGKYPPMNE